MKTTDYIASDIRIDYPLDRLSSPDRILFLDIETTGLSPANAELFLIGAASYSHAGLHIIQYFAEEPGEEKAILEAFSELIRDYDTLITFNGNKFDIPFLEKRAFIYGVDLGLSAKKGVDIYRRIKPYKRLLGMEDMKQKSLERFLGIDRIDEVSGKQMIILYGSYVSDKNESSLKLLLQHNYDDVINLPSLLPLLSYPDVMNGEIKAERAVLNNYRDYEGRPRTEMIIEFTYDPPVPVPVSAGFADCYLMLGGKKGKIRVAVIEGVLKYYYPDPSNYYYLPEEDRAVHKSQGRYVDREYRVQATPATCYVKHRGRFLPQWENIMTPVFRADHRDRTSFFEFRDEMKDDPELFSKYAGHLMNMILGQL